MHYILNPFVSDPFPVNLLGHPVQSFKLRGKMLHMQRLLLLAKPLLRQI